MVLLVLEIHKRGLLLHSFPRPAFSFNLVLLILLSLHVYVGIYFKLGWGFTRLVWWMERDQGSWTCKQGCDYNDCLWNLKKILITQEGWGAWKTWLHQCFIGPGGDQKIVRVKQLVEVSWKDRKWYWENIFQILMNMKRSREQNKDVNF